MIYLFHHEPNTHLVLICKQPYKSIYFGYHSVSSLLRTYYFSATEKNNLFQQSEIILFCNSQEKNFILIMFWKNLF